VYTLQNEIWLEYGELASCGIEENTIKHGVLRGSRKWQAIPNPTDGRKRLIRYATLGESYKEAVRAELCGGLEPDEWLVMQKEQAKQDQQLGSRAALVDKLFGMCDEEYMRFMHLYRDVDNQNKRYLSRSAGIIVVLTEWYKVNGIAWKSSEAIRQAAEWIDQHKSEYFPKNALPTHPTRLKEKVLSYAVEGMKLNEVVSLHRQGNENRATRRKDMWWQQVAIKLKLSGKYQNDRALFRKVRLTSELENLDCPSETTVTTFLRETRNLTAEKQYDLNNKGRQRHRSSMPIANAMHSNVCWEMDGTRTQLVAHKKGDKELKSLYIVAVRDVYSGAYLGYWYGYSEGESAYRGALKMAVDITGTLPYELRYDSFPGSTTAGWKFLAGEKDKNGRTITEGALERHGVKMTCTSSATGKPTTERAFRTLQEVFESENEAYIGQGIRSSTMNARPTELYISRTWKKLLSNGWDFDQAWMSHAEIIAAYNHTEYSRYSKKYAKLDLTPWQMYEQSESEGREIGNLEISELFWNARNEGIRNERIEFKDRGNKYMYTIPAEHFDIILNYQKPNVKVVVRHDPFDYSTVMIFSQKGEFLAEIKEQKSIQIYGKNADWAGAAEWKSNQSAIKKRRADELSKYDMPDEMAVLLPTTTSKKVYNDAQQEYAFRNAGAWGNETKTKAKPVKTGNLDDFDANDYALGQM
jgi:hypothetical protein